MNIAHGEKWILFDMDGVVTSEDGYWRATRCALLDFAARLGHRGAREQVFGDGADALPWKNDPDIRANAQAQNASLNTNWDHCHIMAVALLIRLSEYDPVNIDYLLRIDWQSDELCESLRWPTDCDLDSVRLTAEAVAKVEGLRGFELIDQLAASLGPARQLAVRKGPVWLWLFRHFQCWFIGTDAAAASSLTCGGFPFHQGIICAERLVVDPHVLMHTLSQLESGGWKLGIATGRPRNEIIPTLERFGLLRHFTPEAVTTNDEIEQAEKYLSASGHTIYLSKPNPFPFLRSLFPSAPVVELAFPSFLPLRNKIVVVGDTVGDMSAAAVIGAMPVGVLTGPAGESARESLVRSGATHLLHDVSELPALLRP